MSSSLTPAGFLIAQQAADRGSTVHAPRAWLGELAIDERQYLAALPVQPGADHTRRGGEPDVLQVAQQRMHRRRPRPSITDHHLAPAVD